MPNSQTSLARSSGSFPLVSGRVLWPCSRRKHQSLRERNGMTSSRGLVIWKCLCRLPLSPWKHALSLRVSRQEDLLSSQTNLYLLFATDTRGSCWTNLFDSSRWKLRCLLIVPLPTNSKNRVSPSSAHSQTCFYTILPSSVKKHVSKLSKFPFKCSPNIIFEGWGLHWVFFGSKMGKALRAKTV